mgnify:CR=1 FL=1
MLTTAVSSGMQGFPPALVVAPANDEIIGDRSATIAAPGRSALGRLQPAQSAYPGATIAFYSADQEIIGEGDKAESYFKVVEGLFRAVKFTRDGRRQVFAFFGPGDMFGLDVDATHEATIEAVKPGALAIFSRSRIASATQTDAGLAMTLFRGAAEALRRAVDHMTMIGRSSAVERVAWFLVDATTRFGREFDGVAHCTLAMSRRDIADYLGLTIETISRALAVLKQSGVIALRSSREIEIRKLDLLRRLAAADRDDDAVNRLLA